MLNRYFPEKFRRERLLKKTDHPVAQAYLKTPLPNKKASVFDVDYLTLDFETTGLNAKKEAILSMGYTRVHQGRVLLKENKHQIIRLNFPLPAESVVVHQITDDRMQTGVPLHDALDELVQHMMGKVLLVHYWPIEYNFLRSAMQRVYGVALPFYVVDTMELARRRLQSPGAVMASNALRLGNLRREYDLPRYGAHHALEDSIATAELFLAEVAEMQSRNGARCLKDILSVF